MALASSSEEEAVAVDLATAVATIGVVVSGGTEAATSGDEAYATTSGGISAVTALAALAAVDSVAKVENAATALAALVATDLVTKVDNAVTVAAPERKVTVAAEDAANTALCRLLVVVVVGGGARLVTIRRRDIVDSV